MVAMLVARFRGDVDELTAAYDRAHELIMSQGGAVPSGELRHHCATDDESLYIIGVGVRGPHPSEVVERRLQGNAHQRRFPLT